MKKLLYLCLMLYGLAGYSQKVAPTCLSDHYLNSIIQTSPDVKGRLDLMNKEIRELATLNKTPPYQMTIPVVVYVVYDPATPATNITDAQVQSQIAALNASFSTTAINFCLATRAGAATTMIPGVGTQTTPGILHINNAALSNHNYNTNQQQLVNLADPAITRDKYLRIWVVKDINGIGSGTLGYSIFPNLSLTFDGVVMKYNVFGNASDPTCNCSFLQPTYNLGKILVHEVGHYLGLYHTFQGGCAGMNTTSCATEGDMVCDTPPVQSPNYSCSTGINSCSETPNLPDKINNFMDYGDNNCLNSFTTGQKNRMHNTLNMYRATLFSADNIVYTGTCNYLNVVSASFTPSTYSPCAGVPVNFTSMGGTNTYSWNFGDGTTSNLPNPSHPFSAANSPYTVTLTAVNAAGNSSSISTAQIFVTNCTPINNTDSNWYVSPSCGLKFGTGVPVFDPTFPTNHYSQYNGQIQNDNNGNILFYNNTLSVWNKLHNAINSTQLVLPNYNTPYPNGAVIVPKPPLSGNVITEYYIFTNLYLPPPFTAAVDEGLRYSIVNTSGPTATMGVTRQPVLLPATYGYSTAAADGCVKGGFGISAIKKCNSNDYWIITTLRKGSNVFMVVLSLTSSGLSFNSELQLADNLPEHFIEVAPNGNKIFCYSPYNINSHLYDFNKASGTVSTAVPIYNSGQGLYGASFSPDSKLLYVTDANNKKLYQYNINSANVNNSVKLVGSFSTSPWSIQQGPDGKLYAALGVGLNELGVIHNPNNLITSTNTNACNFSTHGPARNNLGLGLPNLIDAKDATSYFPVSNANVISSYVTGCNSYKFFPNICGTSFNWTFTNNGTGASTTSTATNPVITFTTNGTYTITLRNATNTTILGTTTVTISSFTAPGITGSTSACTSLANNNTTNNSVVLQPGQTVVWSITGGTGVISGANNQSDVTINWQNLPGTILMTVTNADGCIATRSKTIASFCSCDCMKLSMTWQPMLDDTCLFKLIPPPNQICANINVRHTWNFNDGTGPIIAMGYNSYVNYCNDTSGTVFVEILDSNNNTICSETKTFVDAIFTSNSKNSESSDIPYLVTINPNPTKDLINIRINDYSGKVDVNILDINGRLIYEFKNEEINVEKSFDLSGLQKGVYVIKISGNKVNFAEKIIKN
ncbi:PKD domain-containing protein [Flavobacterium sp. 25HG05S-40]|uniref:PKD domain-containing protein n=1 Tax=Flavobacterium sp. 25HG05S-40 TaxID=3458682 RepID=UPI0040450345